MARICILADVRFCSVGDGLLTVHKVNAEGEPFDEYVHTDMWMTDDIKGWWRCNNCGKQNEDYQEIRKHLGKFNELIDPFNYPEKE